MAFACSVGIVFNLASAAPSAEASPRAASPWQSVPFPAQLYPGAMLLLTSGSVMVQNQTPSEGGGRDWWLLTPNAKGSYVHGSWRQVASLPTGYGPLNFASAVLPDGRVVVEGGEYNFGKATFTNRGAIYQPLTNRWTPVAPPKGTQWKTIGDAPATVLANGTFMLGGSGNYTNRTQALLDPRTLKWTITGTGKVDANEEAQFTLLPNGRVLSVGLQFTPNYAETYDPATGVWSHAGNIPVQLVLKRDEIGPLVLRPNGTVFAVGGTPHTAVYDVATGRWSAGPTFPVIAGKRPNNADGPAAVLPDGNVLVDASPGLYKPPSHFFVFNGTSLTRVPSPPEASSVDSAVGYMLMLPTGQVLFNDRVGQMEVYSSGGRPNPAWRPVITKVPRALTAGKTYTVFGDQLNGVTQGAYYGDDYQSATNYPLVRITYGIDRVYYARTFNMSSMAVTPRLAAHANFRLPPHLPAGKASLVVVANGISSASVPVTVG